MIHFFRLGSTVGYDMTANAFHISKNMNRFPEWVVPYISTDTGIVTAGAEATITENPVRPKKVSKKAAASAERRSGVRRT